MNNLIFPIFLFFAEGLFGFETDGVKSLSVMEGDSVTLHTCLNEIQKYEKIMWKFEDNLIAQINKDQTSSTYDGADGRFRDRLELDSESGSLTIRNIRTNHSGLYKVDMFSTSGSSNKKRFNVTVIGVFDPDADKIKPVSVMEGDPVVLNSDVKLHKDDLMLWRFAQATKRCVYNPVHHNPCLSDTTAIAKIDGETREVSLDAGVSEIFNNRLKMDKMSGSLTITNVRTEHSGFYILQISNNTGTKYRRFNVTVRAVTESHSCTVWMSIALVLLLMIAVGCLAAGIKNWNVLLGRLRSYNCCRSKGPQEMESESIVRKGQPLILNTEHTELQRDDVIEWRFKGKVIARIGRESDGGRLELDSTTGSLTITNTTTEHAGVYQLQITHNGQVQSIRKIKVSVTDSGESESLLKRKESRSTTMEVA
ncbi:uncharacterized protein si:dkey-182g1.10 [Megalobrama amblycephala]|uniref:uncharacterized protein si:dkey-182g1.10 n=2 Tax=Megalobrama amblycephala TaxID=75352 RepID=UPI00201480E2|nr:uncharacterized protein si:dkey-182g1.10 [Megalobrama amblycephala]